MKKKRSFFIILAYLLAFSTFLSACASGATTAETTSDASVESQTQEISLEASQATSQTGEEPSGLPEQMALKTNLNEVFVNFSATAENFKGETLNFISEKPIGDMPALEVEEPEMYL